MLQPERPSAADAVVTSLFLKRTLLVMPTAKFPAPENGPGASQDDAHCACSERISTRLHLAAPPFCVSHGELKLVDDQAQVSPVDLPILRVGIDCTLTQLLDKGFLHAVS